MRLYTYLVSFSVSGPPREIQAGTIHSAIILATAERIKAGLRSQIQEVYCMETKERVGGVTVEVDFYNTGN